MENLQNTINVNGVLLPKKEYESKNQIIWETLLLGNDNLENVSKLQDFAKDNIKIESKNKAFLNVGYVKDELGKILKEGDYIDEDNKINLISGVSKKLKEDLVNNFVNIIIGSSDIKAIPDIYNIFIGGGYGSSIIRNAKEIKNNYIPLINENKKLRNDLVKIGLHISEVEKILNFFKRINIDKYKEVISKNITKIIAGGLCSWGYSDYLGGKYFNVGAKYNIGSSYDILPMINANRDSGEDFGSVIKNYRAFSIIDMDLKRYYELALLDVYIYYIMNLGKDYGNFNEASLGILSRNNNYFEIFSMMLKSDLDEEVSEILNKLGITYSIMNSRRVKNISKNITKHNDNLFNAIVNSGKEGINLVDLEKKLQNDQDITETNRNNSLGITEEIIKNVKKHNLYDDSKYANIIK